MSQQIQVAELSLYHFQACPFCAVTRKVIDQLDIEVEKKDTRKEPQYRQELVNGGGKSQVPCLRITTTSGKVHWLYESGDIIQYVRHHAREIAKAA